MAMGWSRNASLLAALSLAVSACSGEFVSYSFQWPVHEASLSDPYAALFTDPYDAVVRVRSRAMDCSGTLISKDLVLTARHCVMIERDDPFNAPKVQPSEIIVAVGGGWVPWGFVGARAIVVPEPCHGTVLFGDHDLAVLVLAKSVTAVKPIPPRLALAPYTGELVWPSGFGMCHPSYYFLSQRQVSATGAITELFPDRMLVDAAACPGDSGGPALDVKTGEIVGAISRGAKWGEPDVYGRRARPQAVATRLDAYASVIAKAAAIARHEDVDVECFEPD